MSRFADCFPKIYLMNRKIYMLVILLFTFSFVQAQKGNITGKIEELDSKNPVGQAIVKISSLDISTTTDDAGFFELKNVPFGKYRITVSHDNFQTIESDIDVNAPSVSLTPLSVTRSSSGAENAPEISSVMLDLEDESKGQTVGELLNSSEDVFVAQSGYIFGSMFFKPRGYDNENSQVMINNSDLSDPENGRTTWSNWGGLNDAMRNKDVFYGVTANPYSFSGFGGLTFMNTNASEYRKQLKLSYSATNRTYRNRLMLTYATGALKNGWALTLSGSRRWSQEGYIPGTYYDAWSYFLAVEKKLSARHRIALTIFGAPTERGQAAGTVQEAYDLAGSNYYNPNWGYQDGEKRNAKVKQFHEPVFILNHYWDINNTTRLTTTLSYTFGEDNWSSLNWFNAADPRPDYYRYLPSYYPGDNQTQEIIRSQWENNTAVSQVNWDRLYQVNYLSNLSGQSARYILENNITKTSQFNFNTFLRKDINPHITATGGANLKLYKGEHYKVMKDLLGSTHWLDIDQYAQRDFPGDSAIAQNDLNNPDRKIYVGDKFGYNYAAYINKLNLWGQAEFTYDKYDFYAALSYTAVQYWRDGYMKNGRHPDNSYGKSTVYNFNNLGVKGGFTYKITGRHFASVNGFYQSRAPYFTNFFISPRVRDKVVPSITNEEIFGGDINYIVRYPWLKARVTYYYTQFVDANEINSFYHDDLNTYVQFIMTGIDKFHQGLEFGAEVKATKTLSIIGVAAFGEYRYTDRPETQITYDNGSRPDTSFTTYLKNFFIPQTPQTALSLGLKYNYKFWFFNVNGNYFDRSYMDFNPERRTQLAIENLGYGDPLIKEITQQQMLKGGFTLDASIGKSLLIDRKYYININFSVTNILDNQNIQSGGFEQNRFDFVTKNVDKFPPKLYYYFGRSFYLNINFRF
jgi:hypothetical protein